MAQENMHGCDLRKGRVSIPGQVYSITLVTRNREPFFRDFRLARTLIGIFREHEKRQVTKSLCFVIMPDHVHWLLELGYKKELSAVVQGVKSLASKRAGRKLWQKGFYDHALRRDEDIAATARYMVLNPQRAGLVEHYNDYPHWDAVWL